MITCPVFPHKKRYGTEGAAEKVILHREYDMRDSNTPSLKSYYCKFCKGWHLTSR
jgi:hypothetical protein